MVTAALVRGAVVTSNEIERLRRENGRVYLEKAMGKSPDMRCPEFSKKEKSA